jgi:low affinity Fe/Cu permease
MKYFSRFSHATATLMGSPFAFVASVLACAIWAMTGPVFDYSNTWQLIINTATTVLTFLAVFLIQNTQNRNSLAVQIKLDELLRAVETARTGLVSLENSTDEEIEKLRREFQRLHDRESPRAEP